MGDDSNIEWTDATWNPVTGCDRTSPGCDNCYALKMAGRLNRMGQANYQNDGDPRTSGPGFGVTCHPHMLDQPLRWKRPRRIFVNSMSDLFHPDVPDEFIARVFAVMALCPQHTFQILTKRPQRMASLLASPRFDVFRASVVDSFIDHGVRVGLDDDPFAWPLPNVWLGVSIENDTYSWRANYLRDTPAAVRWISAEPLLGPLPSLDLTGIDWLVVGGESGPGARPMHPDWVRDLRDRCNGDFPCPGRDDGEHRSSTCACPVNDVPFFFKQWGEWAGGAGGIPSSGGHHLLVDGQLLATAGWLGMNHMLQPYLVKKVGKHAAGRELDGRTWDEYPAKDAA